MGTPKKKQRPRATALRGETVLAGESNSLHIGDKPWLLAMLLVVLTFLAYIPVLRGGFVFDDTKLIVENPLIQASDGLYRLWFTTDAPDYYPLTESLWWLEWRAWDSNATAYHVINLLLHLINVILVWIVLRCLKIPGAWLAALVFAIHPVNVATVAWISEQKNTLSMLFTAAAVLLYLRFDEDGRWRWYGFSLAAFLLALFSKTAVVMLPVVLLGCVWWMRGRLQRKDWLCSVPFFVLSLVLGLFTIWYQYHLALGEPETRTNGFALRVAAAGCAPWFYLSKALLPVNLMAVYPRWAIDPSSWVAYLPGAALVSCFLVFWWRRRTWGRPLLFGLGYFVVMLFPVLGLLKQGPYRLTSVADHWDHWQYYSIIGVITVIIGAGQAPFRSVGNQHRRWGIALAVAMLAMLGGATWQRSSVYATEETLWQDTITKNPAAWGAHNNLGVALAQMGRTQEAMEHYEQALRIKPSDVEAHNNLGLALAQTGKVQDAIAQWEEAVRISPDYADAHYNLAVALARTSKMPEAIEHYEQVVALRPGYAEAHNNLGTALAQVGRMPDAIAQWEEAVRIRPAYAEAHNNLALGLAQTGKMPQAIGQWEQALRIMPNYVTAHANLGNALAQMGRSKDAIAQYEEVLRLDPGFPDAKANLARLQSK